MRSIPAQFAARVPARAHTLAAIVLLSHVAVACGNGGNSPAAMPTAPNPLPVAIGDPGDPRPADPIPAPVPLPPPAPPAPRLVRSRFLAFGDSLTAGTTAPVAEGLMGAGLPQSYPFKLLDLLQARYRSQSFTVENEGRPGEGAQGGSRRLPDVLRAFGPEVVILMHGVNDITVFGRAAIGTAASFVNTMARDARFAGAEVVICTLPPQRSGGPRATDPGVLADYNAAIRDIARGEGATLVDFAAEFGDVRLIGADGLHPTEAGYNRMAQILLETLRRRFEAVP